MCNHLWGKRLLQAQKCIMMFLTLFIWMLPRVWHLEKRVNKMVGLKEDTEILLRRNNTSVMNVAKPLVRAQPLSYITEFTVERSLMHVMCVQRHLAEVQSWFSTEESTLGKNPSSVMNVEKPLVRAQIFLDIENVTLEEKVLGVNQSIYSELFQQKKAQSTNTVVSGFNGHHQFPFEGHKSHRREYVLSYVCIICFSAYQYCVNSDVWDFKS